jgi:Amt family ammonium transporter
MTIDNWLPSLMGFLQPIGLFLVAWGGMASDRARRSATLGSLGLALAVLAYYVTGFAFHLGGAGWVSDLPGLDGLRAIYGGGGELDWGLVGLAGFLLRGGAGTPEAVALFVTYLPAVTSAVLLVVLSLSERASGWQTLAGGLITGALVFPLAACWAWGGGWLSSLGITVQRGHGFVDYAGSSVVYLLSGLVAVGAHAALGRGPVPSDAGGSEEMPAAHFPLLANLGSLLFGVGLTGWVLSVPFHAVGAELSGSRAVANTLLAGSAGILAGQAFCWFTTGSADALMSARSAVSAFVAIAAGAPFVPTWAAVVVGGFAGLVLPLSVFFVERLLRHADATASIAVAASGGLWGTLAVGLFADGLAGQGWNRIGLIEYHTVEGQGVTGFLPATGLGYLGDGPGQMVAQLAGVGAIAALGLVTGLVLFLVLKGFARVGAKRGGH